MYNIGALFIFAALAAAIAIGLLQATDRSGRSRRFGRPSPDAQPIADVGLPRRSQPAPPLVKLTKVAACGLALMVALMVIAFVKKDGADKAYDPYYHCAGVDNDCGYQQDQADAASSADSLFDASVVLVALASVGLGAAVYLRRSRRQCTSCRKLVKAEATICRFCHAGASDGHFHLMARPQDM